MQQKWQELQVGDRVQIVRLPEELQDPEVRAAYTALIRTSTVLLIQLLDDFGHPWTESFEIDEQGRVTTGTGMGQSIALNDDSWVLVKRAG